MAALLAGVLAGSGLWAGSLSGAGPNDKGPLDPLSAAEILTTLEVIEASNKYPAGSFFPIVTLKEPPKAELLAWDPGESFRREAFANVYNRGANRLFEAVVDLKTQKLISWVERPGVQPAVSISEFADADAVVRADPPLAQGDPRPESRPSDIYLDVWAPGSVALPRRLPRAGGCCAPCHSSPVASRTPTIARSRAWLRRST